jgi:hypothetical protein
MRSVFTLCVAACLLSSARADVPPGLGHTITATRRLQNAIGDDDAWKKARYFHFDWVDEQGGERLPKRSYDWDRSTGRFRVEGAYEKGARYTVYFNVKSHEGDVWLAGKKVRDDAQRKKWLDAAYETFVNDSYWLIAPFKFQDHVYDIWVDWAGNGKGPNGESCYVEKMWFHDDVRPAPKGNYWLYIDDKSGLVVEWKLGSGGQNEAQTAYAWSDWKKVGPIMLASTRKGIGTSRVIRFENLKVTTDVDEAALTPPQ